MFRAREGRGWRGYGFRVSLVSFWSKCQNRFCTVKMGTIIIIIIVKLIRNLKFILTQMTLTPLTPNDGWLSCTEKGWRELLQRYSATVPKSLFRRAIRRMRCCEPDTWIRYVVSKVENPDGIEEWEYALYGWCMMKWEKHLQAWVCKCFLRLCGPAWAWTRDLQIMSLLL